MLTISAEKNEKFIFITFGYRIPVICQYMWHIRIISCYFKNFHLPAVFRILSFRRRSLFVYDIFFRLSQVFKCTSKISEFPPLKQWTPNSLFGGFTRRHVRREYLCENAQQTNERQRCKTIKGYAYLRSPQIWRTLTHERLGFRRSRPIWTTVMVITSLFTTRSLNASQPNFATCAEVNQIWKKISKIWGFLL